MQVELLSATDYEPLMKAIRVSHASLDLLDTTGNKLGPADEKLLWKIVTWQHDSVLEHISYTFWIEGISRALLQELARHRHVSMAVQSTRFTLNKLLKELSGDRDEVVEKYCVIPPAPEEFLETFKDEAYKSLKTLAEIAVPNDFKKYLLPECFKTELVLTTNARELAHIIHLRTSKFALWEFQELAQGLFFEAFKKHPELWSFLAERYRWEVEKWEKLKGERATGQSTTS